MQRTSQGLSVSAWPDGPGWPQGLSRSGPSCRTSPGGCQEWHEMLALHGMVPGGQYQPFSRAHRRLICFLLLYERMLYPK